VGQQRERLNLVFGRRLGACRRTCVQSKAVGNRGRWRI